MTMGGPMMGGGMFGGYMGGGFARSMEMGAAMGLGSTLIQHLPLRTEARGPAAPSPAPRPD